MAGSVSDRRYHAGMELDDAVCYRALTARDRRFDGLFFVGVKTTGIYCRPVCTAKTPRRTSCRFFAAAAVAEQAGFRPCLRCRPELAPGHAPLDQGRNVARAAAARIEAGSLAGGRSLETLAANLGLSSRHLRRIMLKEFGVTPIELAQTNRLLLAKRLIAETALPMAQVAFAAGFESVRRFNGLFHSRYRLSPATLRRGNAVAGDSIRLTLAYRPPLAWSHLLRFLALRAIPGVEHVTDDAYARTVAIGPHRGWLRVGPVADRPLLAVDLSTSLTPALPAILMRLRNLFDLDARPDVIARHLSEDKLLSDSLARRPGLRVPGAFDSFELAVRAVLGQQVSVRGASTLAGRWARRFGEPIATPLPGLERVSPTADALAAAGLATISAIGLPTARAESIRTLACAVACGKLDLEPGVDPLDAIGRLEGLPGIGPWTAQYVAMRALHWPDAFPSGDLGLLKAFACRAKAARLKSPVSLERAAEPWRPWRAYGAMHLWESLAATTEKPASNRRARKRAARKPALAV
jgi:AraC family transcriptional regulator of adaptative response / DNA-3-methyladenine glycosylase II